MIRVPSQGFFDDFNRFYGTSSTGASPARLNRRYDAIIAPNAATLRGRRVLDIASHDGRWALAALKAGAAHVVGIEARQDLVKHAEANLAHYGIDKSSYRFVCADAFEGVRSAGSFEVVICAGFYYHTVRHAELFDLMERTGAQLIVVDTAVAPSVAFRKEELPASSATYTRPIDGAYFIQISIDQVARQSDAVEDALTRNRATLVGRPSVAAMEFIAGHFGFSVRRFDWAALLAAHADAVDALIDYRRGWRETFNCHRKQGRHAAA